jgi:outer membrane protein OmpA-like peptidoglycan-associated protein
VLDALVARGVPTAMLTARGYGQSSPVTDNRTEEGRAKNRRVELVKK